jgi:hypothetical protein
VEPGTKPENYLVKGMNEKYNYFVNKTFILDLEYNVPVQAITGNTLLGKGVNKKLVDQRKIFEDCSRFLSID